MSDEKVLVDRDDLRAVLPTMKAPDPYFQPAEHDEWLAAFKRVQATLDAGVPVQQDKPDAMPAFPSPTSNPCDCGRPGDHRPSCARFQPVIHSGPVPVQQEPGTYAGFNVIADDRMPADVVAAVSSPVEGEGEELTEVQQEPEDAGRRLMRSTQRDQREAYRAGKRGVTLNACGFTPAAHSSDELRDRIAEALWRHDAQIDFPQVGWACEATTYEKTIRRKEADAVLAVLREEGLLP